MQSATAKAKGQIDAAELSLQNLLYEKAYYLKEIRACQSFRSAACTMEEAAGLPLTLMSFLICSDGVVLDGVEIIMEVSLRIACPWWVQLEQ